MDLTRMRRAIVLTAMTALVVSACSSGGSASPSAAASVAPTDAAATATPEPSAAAVTLEYLVDESQANQQLAKAFADAYTAKHPNVTINVQSRPGGTEGDNLVKTRLATGDMTDIFWYNSGSLLQALNPSQTLVDLAGEPYIANIFDSFIPTVSQNGGIFGVPSGTAMGGGILYNKKVYADNGLTVPKTWAEFEANNEKLKAAGITAVGATYKAPDDWTSQLFVLSDYCNVQAAVPNFADDYTNNKIKYADTPAALAGFEHTQEGFDKGWYQKDFGAASFDDGLNALATGEFAQYPMLTFALGTIAENHPEAIQDIGFFGLPGTDAAKNCATIWMPAATYIPNTTTGDKLAAAKDFLGFIASVEGAEAASAAQPPSGPYVIKGAQLPADALPAVLDIQAYLDNDAATPALEFLSPVKGPSLAQILVAVGTGLNSATEGATLYDKDIEKPAKQLGLPGW
jgi:raffinose/stachyose/melibiose transport system substrate-binding protein